MNIQISVLIWAILCFGILALVLDRLLFRPLLAFMDARRQKIENAKLKKAETLQANAEAVRLAEEKQQEAEKEALAAAAASLENTRRETEREIAAKKENNLKLLAESRLQLAEETKAMQGSLDEKTGELVRAFAERLLF